QGTALPDANARNIHQRKVIHIAQLQRMSRSVLSRYASQRAGSKFTRLKPAILRAVSVGGRLRLEYCTAEKIESVGEQRLQIPKRPTCLLAACGLPGG